MHRLKSIWLAGLIIAPFLLIPSQANANFSCWSNQQLYSLESPITYCSESHPYSPNIVLGSSNQAWSDPEELDFVPIHIQPILSPTPSPEIIPPTPSPTLVIKKESDPIESTLGSTSTASEESLEVEADTNAEVDSSPPPPAGVGLNTDLIFDLINDHRTSKGLPAYQKDDRLCSIAQKRAPQLNNEMFGGGYVHQGFNQMDLDHWITENMVHQPSEQSALNWWLNSSLHRRAVESTSHTHSCGICSGNTCIQLFTGWIEK